MDSEMKIVSNYISKFGEETLKSNYKKVKYQNRKRRVKAVLKKIIGRWQFDSSKATEEVVANVKERKEWMDLMYEDNIRILEKVFS